MISPLEFIEKFIPSHLKHNPVDLIRPSVLVGTLLIYIGFTVIVLLAVLFLVSLDKKTLVFAYIPILICLFIYCFSLFTFKKTGNFRFCGNMTVTVIFLSICTGINLTGGYHNSPISMLIVLVPILAFLLAGRLDGFRWIFVALTASVLLYVLDQYKFLVFKLIDDERLIEVSAVFLQAVLIVMTCGAIFMYELINERLKHQLDIDRQEFEYKASHDSLTGIPNRFEFFRRIEKNLNECKELKKQLCIAFIDLDGFKPINDLYGHFVGDVLLTEIAKRLESHLRSLDTAARIGGDEFALILSEIDGVSDISNVINDLQNSISKPVDIGSGKMVSVRGSIGIAIYPNDSESADELCRFADAAMYKAKETKNTYVTFNEEIRLSMEVETSDNFRSKRR